MGRRCGAVDDTRQKSQAGANKTHKIAGEWRRQHFEFDSFWFRMPPVSRVTHLYVHVKEKSSVGCYFSK